MTSAPLDHVFHALADATRRAMLAALARAPRSVGQLAEPHRMSLAAASKHIKVLESAGLLRREVQGRTHVCHLAAAPLADAAGYLSRYERFWSARLDALSDYLDAEARDEARPARGRARAALKASKRAPARRTKE